MDFEIGPGALIRRAQNIIASEMDGEYLIMSVEKGSYIALRDVSARLWELLEDARSLESLLESLLLEYDVDRETCKDEVYTFLRQMYEGGLVTFEVQA